MDTTFLAAIFALSAATGWGAGDFIGGLAARRIGPFQTVLVTNTVQLAVVVSMALARFEHFPPLRDLLWGAVACLLGIMGLGSLLRGFAIGRMDIAVFSGEGGGLRSMMSPVVIFASKTMLDSL